MASLPFSVAQNLAGSLTTIGHPFSAAAINATAMDLVRWCKGAILNGHLVPPEQQAEELIQAARTSWEEWPEKGGTKQLRALFRRLYEPAADATKTYEVPAPPTCKVCDDTGWESYQMGGNDYSRRCPKCTGTKKPIPAPCQSCGGKGTILVDGGSRRMPCSCLSPERRQQIREYLQTSLHEMPERSSAGDPLRRPS